ncbi:hypothetical protein EH165_01755 [Nakamurella antarctica]|uniref:Uncharacterized protein n=1 Tax=Nakamurella antarctica TaxID=1902245 RepID=A0A3G8ZIS0_9ACTN|nr:hypothetical protein [Nakamurella antarctica]AZI57078.1 hypothetical protein EH165_01755 [Nakamurella antarctica]
MTETPEQRVERLQAELNAAQIAQLQQQLAQARGESGYASQPAPTYGQQMQQFGGASEHYIQSALQYGQAGQQSQQVPQGQQFVQPPYGTEQAPNPFAGQLQPGVNLFGPGTQVFTGGQLPPAIQQLLTSRNIDMGALSSLVGSGGGMGPSAYGTPGANEPLSPAPRRVPFALRLCLFQWRWWELFAMVMVVAAPIALWMFYPVAAPAAAIAMILVIWTLRIRGMRMRGRLLKWGMPARVCDVEVVSSGTYYSGVTYNNQVVAVARGWEVERSLYSGPATTSKIRYELGGEENVLILRGLGYRGGVILADTRKPRSALCVSSFPFDLKRDETGEWLPTPKVSVWIGSVAAVLLHAAWVTGAVLLVQHIWLI